MYKGIRKNHFLTTWYDWKRSKINNMEKGSGCCSWKYNNIGVNGVEIYHWLIQVINHGRSCVSISNPAFVWDWVSMAGDHGPLPSCSDIICYRIIQSPQWEVSSYLNIYLTTYDIYWLPRNDPVFWAIFMTPTILNLLHPNEPAALYSSLGWLSWLILVTLWPTKGYMEINKTAILLVTTTTITSFTFSLLLLIPNIFGPFPSCPLGWFSGFVFIWSSIVSNGVCLLLIFNKL